MAWARRGGSWKTWLSVLGVAFLFVLLRWNSFNAPFEHDEGEYAYSAWIMRRGLLPYEDAFLQKPPLIIYVYLFSQLLFSGLYWPPRILAVLFLAATIILTSLIARKEFPPASGLVTAWLLVPMLSFPWLTPFAANTEVFMLLPLMGALLIYVSRKAKANWRSWFLFGVCSSLALLFKPICVLTLLFIALVWATETWLKHRSWARVGKYLTAALAGGAITTVIILLPFLLQDGGRSFWECVIVFNFYYTQNFGSDIPFFWDFLKIFLRHWPVLFILTGGLFWLRPPRWWFYLGLLLISWLGISRSYFSHYYLLIIPFWALAAAYSWQTFSERVPFLKPAERRLVAVSGVVLIVFSFCWPYRQQLALTPAELVTWVYGTNHPFVESLEVAQQLARLTSPSDLVFIAGSEPQILYYARRESASRFVITYPLMWPTPQMTNYQTEAIDQLRANPPQAIVLSRGPNTGLWKVGRSTLLIDYLNQVLREDYHLVGGYLWRDDIGVWREPITSKEASQSSLLVFLRDGGKEEGKATPLNGKDWFDGRFFRRVSRYL